MIKKWIQNGVQSLTFQKFVKPSFWTTLQWFSPIFPSPKVTKSIQNRQTKHLEKNTSMKWEKSIPVLPFYRKSSKNDSQSDPQGPPKTSPKPSLHHPGTQRWPRHLPRSQKVTKKVPKWPPNPTKWSPDDQNISISTSQKAIIPSCFFITPL